MFPGAGAQVYRNEAGEVLGWDYPSDDPPERDDYDDAHDQDRPCKVCGKYCYEDDENGDSCVEQSAAAALAAIDEDAPTYKIVRFRQNSDNEVIETGLSLEDAKAHCNDPTSHGDGWFDGFTEE